MKKLWLLILVSCFGLSCEPIVLDVPAIYVNDSFWLRHKLADFYVTARGNSESGVIFINVHGGPASGAQYIALSRPASYEALEKQGIVFYYDQRGVGLSTGSFPASFITLEQYVDDLDQVVEIARQQYGEQKSIFLLSRSWGGLLCSAYLSEKTHQNKISGWISISSAHDIPLIRQTGKSRLMEVAFQQIGQNHSADAWEAIRAFASSYDPTVASFANLTAYWSKAYEGMQLLSQDQITLENESYTGLRPEIIYQHTAYSQSEVDQNDAQDVVSLLFEELGQYSPDLGTIQIPTLFIHGAYDLLVPPAVAEISYQKLGTPVADKFIRIYERAAHLPMTQYEAFVPDATFFIQQYK